MCVKTVQAPTSSIIILVGRHLKNRTSCQQQIDRWAGFDTSYHTRIGHCLSGEGGRCCLVLTVAFFCVFWHGAPLLLGCPPPLAVVLLGEGAVTMSPAHTHPTDSYRREPRMARPWHPGRAGGGDDKRRWYGTPRDAPTMSSTSHTGQSSKPEPRLR